jgi:uncharacterized protein (DUF2267 family)
MRVSFIEVIQMSAQTHIDLFDTTLHETYGWIRDVLRETGWEDRHYALQGLRGVLHAVRDEITADQSGHLSAQLPTLLRGIYFEGWDPSRAPATDRTGEAFVDRIRPNFTGYGEAIDFKWLAGCVLRVLKNRVPGEYEKLKATMPKEVRQIWP